MKSLIFLFSLFSLFSLISYAHAMAGVEFQHASKLPADLQTKVAKTIAKSCPSETAKGVRIYENNTLERTQKIDHGQFDHYFSSYFSVYTTDQDGYHPRTLPLIVESVRFGLVDGDPRVIRLVHGCDVVTDYQCVAQKLQAVDSDIYYNLSPAEINELLFSSSDRRHETVVQATISCASKNK